MGLSSAYDCVDGGWVVDGVHKLESALMILGYALYVPQTSTQTLPPPFFPICLYSINAAPADDDFTAYPPVVLLCKRACITNFLHSRTMRRLLGMIFNRGVGFVHVAIIQMRCAFCIYYIILNFGIH